MKSATSVSEWLPWLGRVRFLAITFLLGIVVAARQLTPDSISVRSFVPLVALWYMLAIVYVILQRWTPQARVHAPLQIICDLLIITGVVYTTGAQDSYFISLYLLAILMASVLFSRRGVFLVAGASFALLAGVIELAHYGVLPRTANSAPMQSSSGLMACQQFLCICRRRIPRQSSSANTPQEGRRTRREERRT